MTQEIRLSEEFGPRLSDGTKALGFRLSSIDPYLDLAGSEEIVLDFTGIRSANSSFVNALISGLFEQHGTECLGKLVFRGCLPTLQVLIQSAVDLGLQKHVEKGQVDRAGFAQPL